MEKLISNFDQLSIFTLSRTLAYFIYKYSDTSEDILKKLEEYEKIFQKEIKVLVQEVLSEKDVEEIHRHLEAVKKILSENNLTKNQINITYKYI